MTTATENPPTQKRSTEPKAETKAAPDLRIGYMTNLCTAPEGMETWFTEDGAVKGPYRLLAISTLSPVFSGDPSVMTGEHQNQIKAFMGSETFFLLAVPGLGAQRQAMIPSTRVFFNESEAQRHMQESKQAG